MTTRAAAVATAIGGLVGSLAVYAYFVRTAAGQRLDARLVPRHGFAAAGRLLAAYDRHVIVAEIVVLTAVLAIAAQRRLLPRGVVAAVMPVVVVGVVNLAKAGLSRPAFTATGSVHNSFPSGHVALAAATVIAVCLVLPLGARLVAALVGTIAVALVAVATIAAGWHRFSDGLGAVLIAVAGGALVVLVTRGTPPEQPASEDRDRLTHAAI